MSKHIILTLPSKAKYVSCRRTSQTTHRGEDKYLQNGVLSCPEGSRSFFFTSVEVCERCSCAPTAGKRVSCALPASVCICLHAHQPDGIWSRCVTTLFTTQSTKRAIKYIQQSCLARNRCCTKQLVYDVHLWGGNSGTKASQTRQGSFRQGYAPFTPIRTYGWCVGGLLIHVRWGWTGSNDPHSDKTKSWSSRSGGDRVANPRSDINPRVPHKDALLHSSRLDHWWTGRSRRMLRLTASELLQSEISTLQEWDHWQSLGGETDWLISVERICSSEAAEAGGASVRRTLPFHDWPWKMKQAPCPAGDGASVSLLF